MRTIEARLAKLERSSSAADNMVVGVLTAPEPKGSWDAWAEALLREHGWRDRRCIVTVIPSEWGRALVPLTQLGRLRDDPEQVWIRASEGVHFFIVVVPPQLGVLRFEDRAEEQFWAANLEREMAAAGGPDAWVKGV